MTEAEWLAADEPGGLVRWLLTTYQATDRQARLIKAGWCRTANRLGDARGAAVIDLAEDWADVRTNADRGRHIPAVRAARLRLNAWANATLRRVNGWAVGYDEPLVVARVHMARGNPRAGFVECLHSCRRAVPEADAEWVAVVREVLGNPFRWLRCRPRWRTPTVAALAISAYTARDWGTLPVLADALEDAGCDAAELLAHLRGPGPHARGCWALDLVLGKG